MNLVKWIVFEVIDFVFLFVFDFKVSFFGVVCLIDICICEKEVEEKC